MSTEQALELLSLRLAGALSAKDAEALDAWLRENPDHEVIAEGWQSSHETLQAAFEPRRDASTVTAQRVANVLPLVEIPTPSKISLPEVQLPPVAVTPVSVNPIVTETPYIPVSVNPVIAAPTTRPVATSPKVQSKSNALPKLFAFSAALLLVAAGAVFLFKGHTNKNNTPEDKLRVELAQLSASQLTARQKPISKVTEKLELGKVAKTEAGEKKRVILPDGSLVYLNANTQIELSQDRKLSLQQGEIFVEAVSSELNKDLPVFTVEAPGRTVTAKGTKFAVTAGKAKSSVLVTQGKVNINGLNETLLAGNLLTGESDQIQEAPRANAALDWTRDLMISAESPLVPAGKFAGGGLVAQDANGEQAKLSMVKYHVDVVIEDGYARTTIDQTYFNHANWQLEGTFYFPLPADASLSRLAMYVDGTLMEGGMAERDHARNVYETIRYQRRDPALLEWVDGSLFKMRVFPLEARREKRIILSYHQKLPVAYSKMTYRFPSGHSMDRTNEWSYSVKAKGCKLWTAKPLSHPLSDVGVKGEDLIVQYGGANVKVDRDIVVEFDTKENNTDPRFNSFDFEGSRYYSLRLRPNLPPIKGREQRNWFFVVETSGSRDPLLARTQIEVLRNLLTHAEYTDTFNVVTANTKTQRFADAPVACTPSNVNKAIAFLEKAHLIGALDLGRCLGEVSTLLQIPNTYLVHLGAGTATLGNQQNDLLVKQIPQGVKYVGLAVGKRFTAAFMKNAAVATGGFFTQINPDDSPAWRGFEVASTLNAPRLLDLTATDDTGRIWLFNQTSLSHGEELACVTRVKKDEKYPKILTLKGSLDGQPYEQKIKVAGITEGAGYLPRTWARHEIDRLVAIGADVNRDIITKLSKEMYVMSPFTSLLVLENDKMYEEFKVDRGRKDHWAQYPAPAKIPVVFIPDPENPIAGTGLQNQLMHPNQVLSSVLVRQSPEWLYEPYRGRAYRQGSITAGQAFGSYAIPDDEDEEQMVEEVEELLNEAIGIDPEIAPATGSGSGRGEDFFMELGLQAPRTHTSNGTMLGRGGEENKIRTRNRFAMGDSPLAEVREKGEVSHGMSGATKYLRLQKGGGTNREEAEFARQQFRTSDSVVRLKQQVQSLERQKKSIDRLEAASQSPREGRGTQMQSLRKEMKSVKKLQEKVKDSRKELRDLEMLEELSDETSYSRGTGFGAPRYYSRVSWVREDNIFRDLLQFAPGMNTSLADSKAVVEKEATPNLANRRGKVSDDARKLIDSVRTTDWTEYKSGEKEKTFSFKADRQGRYVYQRTLWSGLLEQVFCDGETIWTLYPEIGVGSKRPVSRFHRDDLLNLMPDFLPPSEDLSVGHNVVKLDDNTIALRGLSVGTEDGPTKYLERRLIIKEKRLVERQTVLMPEAKVLEREVYEVDGTVKGFDENGKEYFSFKIAQTKCPLAYTTPNTEKLVVITLPYRSFDKLYTQYGFSDPHNQFEEVCVNGVKKQDLPDLMGYISVDNNHRHNQDAYHIVRRAINEGDRRPGWFVFISAMGLDLRSWNIHHLLEKCDQRDPLVRYLSLLDNDDYRAWVNQNEILPGRDQEKGLLGKLKTIRMIGLKNSFTENELDTVSTFVRTNADNIFGWCVMSHACDYYSHNVNGDVHRIREKRLSELWKVLGEKSSRTFSARYESARYLYRSAQHRKDEQAPKDKADAQKAFRELFKDALKLGVLPPLDSEFRQVLNDEGGDWPSLMRQAAAECAENKARPLVVRLAWQVYQLGDYSLSDALLASALDTTTDEDRLPTYLAAAQFYSSTDRIDRADALVNTLLKHEKWSKMPYLWRTSSGIASSRGDRVNAIARLEKALDLEYANLPESFPVEPIRADYSELLNHYEWLADAATALKAKIPADMPARVVKAADRWRSVDPDATTACDRAAKILRKLGAPNDVAWDYLTTPLDLKPNESAPWLNLASTMRREGDYATATRCYQAAFQAEPTNAQILWDHAQMLRQNGKEAEGRNVLKQIADGKWQPRFSGLQSEAKQLTRN